MAISKHLRERTTRGRSVSVPAPAPAPRGQAYRGVQSRGFQQVSIAEALIRLRAYAFAHECLLNNVAAAVVARELRLD